MYEVLPADMHSTPPVSIRGSPPGARVAHFAKQITTRQRPIWKASRDRKVLPVDVVPLVLAGFDNICLEVPQISGSAADTFHLGHACRAQPPIGIEVGIRKGQMLVGPPILRTKAITQSKHLQTTYQQDQGFSDCSDDNEQMLGPTRSPRQELWKLAQYDNRATKQ